MLFFAKVRGKMKGQGHLRKMKVGNASTVQYHLVLDNESYHLNPYIGDKITIEYLNDIHCMACGQSTNKSYNQGYCYRCFQILAVNDRCVMAPEYCHYDQGTCRESDWGEAFCMQPHVVYVSWTSGFKVGLTRLNNQVTRWIDQGATHAIPVCLVKTRKEAGLVEDHLRQWYRDRTQWKSMIQMVSDTQIDIQAEKDKMIEKLDGFDIKPLDEKEYQFEYPVDAIGELTQLSLDKQKKISGYLLGIKAQYLILDSGVVNIRKHGSYLVEVSMG